MGVYTFGVKCLAIITILAELGLAAFDIVGKWSLEFGVLAQAILFWLAIICGSCAVMWALDRCANSLEDLAVSQLFDGFSPNKDRANVENMPPDQDSNSDEAFDDYVSLDYYEPDEPQRQPERRRQRRDDYRYEPQSRPEQPAPRYAQPAPQPAMPNQFQPQRPPQYQPPAYVGYNPAMQTQIPSAPQSGAQYNPQYNPQYAASQPNSQQQYMPPQGGQPQYIQPGAAQYSQPKQSIAHNTYVNQPTNSAAPAVDVKLPSSPEQSAPAAEQPPVQSESTLTAHGFTIPSPNVPTSADIDANGKLGDELPEPDAAPTPERKGNWRGHIIRSARKPEPVDDYDDEDD